MFASRRGVVAASSLLRRAVVQPRRSVMSVPRLGSEDQMRAEAVEQIKARVAAQKAIMSSAGHKSHDEEVDEMWKWIKISLMIAFPICVLSGLKDVIFGEHHHAPEGPMPEYMKIRNKSFPWECEDCDLFDLKCWRKCRAEKE